jgi:hypothetical protein
MMLCLSLALPLAASAYNVIGPAWATKMVFYNASNADCVVLVALSGNTAGCPQNVVPLRYVDFTANGAALPLTQFTNINKGWFLLKRGHTVQLYSTTVSSGSSTPNYCLDSFNIGFQGIGNTCPVNGTSTATMNFPNSTPGPNFNQDVSKYTPIPAIAKPKNGTNGFEGSINLTTANAPESVDISCVNGANSKIQMQITPPVGGPYWTYNAGPQAGGNISYATTANFENSWLNVQPTGTTGCDDNCVDPKTGLARPGVFPYGCSICNHFPDPAPPCGGSGYPAQYCAAKNFNQSPNPGSNGCQLNRSPLLGAPLTQQKFGGTVLVTYYGPLTPPVKCN